MKKTGIILINYKDYAKKFLKECRDSLREQGYSDFMVYIVDNASSQESQNYLKEIYPETIIIPRDNGNYAAANNAGIKKAIEDGCEYFVVANMDTKFQKDWLKELVGAIKNNSKIGMAQSKMLLYPKNKDEWNSPKINSLGNVMHFLGFGFTDSYGKQDKDMNGLPEIKGYASGCSFITRKDVIDKIGFYDEEYYMYHDDIEMGWRAKLAGYKIVLAPKSIMYHKYEFSRSVRMLYYMERNRYLVMLHYYSLLTLLLFLPAILAMELGMIFYSIVNGWFKIKLKANIYFLKPSSWQKIFKKRKQINKIRRVKDKEIIKNFEGRVLFQEIDNPVLKYIANPMFNIYLRVVKKIYAK
ncbi:glycosyltransferase family 2 protein [Candidatus Falkowbacteria bacterium]|jgi:GT2 family glycosyltransferase|nr:glycosyltransferase family 2 protein [Candidatus Falkowbacteria bacterium]MBT4433243.1 glycosyltransferase family 2 protein [Candidatus Falkowbacteria bacterium]